MYNGWLICTVVTQAIVKQVENAEFDIWYKWNQCKTRFFTLLRTVNSLCKHIWPPRFQLMLLRLTNKMANSSRQQTLCFSAYLYCVYCLDVTHNWKIATFGKREKTNGNNERRRKKLINISNTNTENRPNSVRRPAQNRFRKFHRCLFWFEQIAKKKIHIDAAQNVFLIVIFCFFTVRTLSA